MDGRGGKPMSAHTPGPCKFHIDRGDGTCRYCGSLNVSNVRTWCPACNYKPDTLCPLHAAAPTLLEALEYMERWATQNGAQCPYGLKQARAAIRAAKGETV